LAKVLVSRAAEQANDVQELYQILADEVEGDSNKKKFLASAGE